MSKTKKRYFYIIIPAAVLFIVIVLLFLHHNNRTSKNEFIHKTFPGTILSYEQTDQGLTFVLDHDGTTNNKVFILSENTMFPDTALEEKIRSQETGIRVTVESEFWTHDSHDVYPAVMISP